MGILSKLFGGAKEEGQGLAAQLLQQISGDLNLSGDQLEKMKSLFQQFREKRKAAKAAGGDFKLKIKEFKQELKSGIHGLLNDDQRKKFQANIEKYKDFFQ